MSAVNPLRWAEHLANGTAHAVARDFTQARLSFFRAWPDTDLPPLQALDARLRALELDEPEALPALVAEVTGQVKTMTEILDALEITLAEGYEGPTPSFATIHRALIDSARASADLACEPFGGGEDADSTFGDADASPFDRDGFDLGELDLDALAGGIEKRASGQDPERAARERASFDPDPYGRGPLDRDRDGRPDADRFE